MTADGLVPFLNLGDYAPGASPQRNFNPFSPNRAVVGYTFESLYQVDNFNCGETPWLATDYAWEGTQKLTFTLRDGVKWHDGKPFTAEDVVFTYEMIKKHPALDLRAVGPVLDSVTARDDTVVMEFAQPAVLLFSKIAMVDIVPKHIWANAGDPVTFTNDEAVGTGPYQVKTFNARQMVLDRDPGYWQADKIKVKELRFTHSPEGQVDQLRLERGEYDMNAMFVPDIEKVYVAKDPEHNKYWFAPGGVISLYPNLTKAPFDDVEFRRALTTAFDRQGIADKAQFGYVKTASQTGLILPNQEEWLDPDIENGGKIDHDLDTAKQALDDAGYTVDGDGRRLGKDGRPLAFEFKVPTGWNDWIQAAQIVRGNFDELGIAVDVATPQQATYEQDRARQLRPAVRRVRRRLQHPQGLRRPTGVRAERRHRQGGGVELLPLARRRDRRAARRAPRRCRRADPEGGRVRAAAGDDGAGAEHPAVVRGVWLIIFVISVTGWAYGAKIKRAQIITLRTRDYITAAKLAGDGTMRIVFREIMPNMTSLVVVGFMGSATAAIGAEAGLSFLGLGDLSTVSWGTMLYWADNGGALLTGQWPWLIAPGLALTLLVTAMTLINFGVDALSNPALREE